DGFDYPEGSVNNQNGGSGWNSVWYDCGGGGNSVTSNSITYSSLNVTGNKLTDIGSGNNSHRRLPDFHGISGTSLCEGSTIWLSFLARKGSFADLNGFAGVSLFDSVADNGCSTDERFFIGKRTGSENWGIARAGGGSQDSAVRFDEDTTLVVARLDFFQDNTGAGLNAYLWVNPCVDGADHEPSRLAPDAQLIGVANFCFDRVRVQAGP